MSVGPHQRKPKNPLAFQNMGQDNNRNGNVHNPPNNGEGNFNKPPNSQPYSREDIPAPPPPKIQTHKS